MPAHDISRRSDWAAVAVLLWCGVIAAAQIGKVPPVMLVVREDLGLSLAGGGWAVSIVSGVGIVLGVAAGGLVDQFGRRSLLLIGLWIAAIGAACAAIAVDAPWFLAARAVEGLGYLFIVVSAPALVVEATAPDDRPLALAFWGAFVPVGISLATLVTVPLASLGSWRTAFWVFAVAILATVPLVSRVVPRSMTTEATSTLDVWGLLRGAIVVHVQIYRHLPSIVLAASFGAYGLMFLAFLSFLPTYLETARGTSPAAAGAIASAVIVASLVGTMLAGVAFRYRLAGSGLWIISISAMGAAGAVLFGAGPGLATVIALSLVCTVSNGIVASLAFANVPVYAPSAATLGLANGVLAQLAGLGATLGPPLFGAVVDAGGWRSGVVVFALASVVAVALVGLLSRLPRRTGPD